VAQWQRKPFEHRGEAGNFTDGLKIKMKGYNYCLRMPYFRVMKFMTEIPTLDIP
jgi:hypothetical protein